MIVHQDDLKGLSREEIEEMALMCHSEEHREMFCVFVTHMSVREFEHSIPTMSDLFHVLEYSCFMVADMILYQNEDGRVVELKNRNFNFGSLKVNTEEVVSYVTTLVPDDRRG